MNSLSEIFHSHCGRQTQKWSSYLPVYDRVLTPLRHQPVRLLEIGVMNGGSLEIWDRYFSQARLLMGCDINTDCARLRYDSPHLQVIVGDVNTEETRADILARAGQLDVIIDDGSHVSRDIILTFVKYFPSLAHGGIYVAEDLHCSYWPHYGGGLHHECSAISFFKHLVDLLNHEHWLEPIQMQDHLQSFRACYGIDPDPEWLKTIESIEFCNSMCIIRKNTETGSELGISSVQGELAEVNDNIAAMNGHRIDIVKNIHRESLAKPGRIIRLRRLLSRMRHFRRTNG